MNKKLLFLCAAIVTQLGAVTPGDIAIDEIKAIVQNESGTSVITESDVTRRSFDGAQHTIKDIVLEAAKDLHGEKLGINLENDDIDRYLRAMGADMNKEALTTMAKEHGYDSLDEFYQDLKRLYRANATSEQEVRSHLTVSEQEAKTYYDNHPEYKDSVYYIQTTTVPFDETISREEQKKSLEDPKKRSELSKTIDWQAPVDIAEKDIAQDKEFIKNMNVGDVHVLQKETGFMLYKLKNFITKHAVSFDERRSDIIKKLREDKLATAYEQYNKNVLDDVRVTYVH